MGARIERDSGVKFGRTQVWRFRSGLALAAQAPGHRVIERDDAAVPGVAAHHLIWAREEARRKTRMAILPAYSQNIDPAEVPWVWLKRNGPANFGPKKHDAHHATARNRTKSAQRRPCIIAACDMPVVPRR